MIAYQQAIMISNIISGECGEIFEQFPYWTEDEILDIRAQQAIAYFEKYK